MHKAWRRSAAVAMLVLLLAPAAVAQWTWTPQTGRWINLKRLPKETPELQLEFARSQLVEGDYDKAWKETDKFIRFYGDSPLADQNQFLRGEIRLAQGKHRKAAGEFQKVVALYPESDLFDEVIARQYEIGDYFFARGEANLEKKFKLSKKKPFKQAIEVYEMVIEHQPFTNTAAEAQYKIGKCQHACKNYLAASYDFRRVIEDYPDSDWVDEAAYGLAQCYYDAALPPEYDQVPSRLAIEAVESFNARFPDDPRTGELAQVRGEMYENIAESRLQTARFYEKRREFEAARLSYKVVTQQFGDTAAAEEARAWLEENPASERRIPEMP